MIELLVVISIVGLLAALLLSAVRHAKDSARAVSCVSNLHQLGLSMAMYLDDYNRYFPYSETVPGGRLWYFGLESPYSPGGAPGSRNLDKTKAKLHLYFQTLHGIEICPSYDYRSPKWRQKFKTVSYGYGYNRYGLADKSPSELGRPSTIVCFADSAQVNTIQPPASATNPMLEEFYYVHPGVPPEIPTTHFRHKDQANVLFCDGHAEPLPMAQGTLDNRMPDQKVGRFNPDGDTSLFW